MEIYRCGRMENILGTKWYTIQKKSFLGIWVTSANFKSREEMERIARMLEKLGNVVIRMNQNNRLKL